MILTKDNIKSFCTEAYLSKKIVNNSLFDTLIIFPTNRRLRAFKKNIISHYTNKPISEFHIETLTTLTTKLFKINRGFIPLSEAAATVLIKETADELELNYFSTYTKGIPFGTLDKIKNVISEYKRNGITPEILEAEAGKLSGGEKNKALDISKIFRVFSEKCKKLNAFEIGDIYSEIINLSEDEFKQSFKKIFPKVNNAIFDGFDEFTNPEVMIINNLNAVLENKLVINFDYYINNQNIFSHLDKTHDKLIEHGFKSVLDTTPKGKIEFRNIIREKLFNSSSTERIDKYSQNIFSIKAPNKRLEIETIAQAIKAEILNSNAEPQQFCVVFNSISNYSSIIRDIFNKYGLPLNLTDRIPLKSSQPVIAAICLLELIENDFHFDDLMRVLTNKYLKFEEIDLSNIIFTANKLKILRGINNWNQQINDAVNLLNYDTEIFPEEKENLKRRYLQAKKDVNEIYESVRIFKTKLTKVEFLTSIKQLLLKLRLPQSVIENTVGREEELIKSITVFLNTLDEILLLVDGTNPEKKYSLNYYLEQIRTMCNWARFNVKEKSDQGILVTAINEIRGLEFDYVFIGGMCDGIFPTKYSPEIFYSGSFQKKEQMHVVEERFHFYQALCAWRKKLYLTLPLNDVSKELVESTFYKEFVKLFAVTELTLQENKIYSQEDLLIHFGKSYPNTNFLEKYISTSDEIKNKIATHDFRINNVFDPNEYCGYIGGDAQIKEFLNEYSTRQFSISQLETLAKCPFKYLTDRILKLETLEQPSDEIQPIELGNILHTILYEFYTTLNNRGIELKEEGSKDFNIAKDLLFEIAKTKIDYLGINSPITFFEKEKILGIDGKIENSILYKFLKYEAENTDGFIPKYFELGFGSFREESFQYPLEIHNLKLRGKIDRIDVDEENKMFNIIDYKLKGKKPTIPELKEGLSLQLPVYLMAAEQYLKKNSGDYTGYRMIIYSLDYKEDNFGKLILKPEGRGNKAMNEIIIANEELLNSTKSFLIEYFNKIKEGKFNLSELSNREEKVCRYCNFKPLCRVEEIFE